MCSAAAPLVGLEVGAVTWRKGHVMAAGERPNRGRQRNSGHQGETAQREDIGHGDLRSMLIGSPASNPGRWALRSRMILEAVK